MIVLGVVCVAILAANLVFSKVNFNKAAEYIAGMDLENAEKYLKKSKIAWLKLNDYEKTDQLCFANGNQLADRFLCIRNKRSLYGWNHGVAELE